MISVKLDYGPERLTRNDTYSKMRQSRTLPYQYYKKWIVKCLVDFYNYRLVPLLFDVKKNDTSNYVYDTTKRPSETERSIRFVNTT